MTTTLPPATDREETHRGGSRRGRGWLGIGAAFGLALGAGLHFGLPANGTDTPNPSAPSSSAVSATPSATSSDLPTPALSPVAWPIDASALDDLDWSPAAPSGTGHGSDYPNSTIATDEILAEVAPLWTLELFSEAYFADGTGPTVVYLIDPAGERYEVVSIARSYAVGAELVAWDPDEGLALVMEGDGDESNFLLVDLAARAWAPVGGFEPSGYPYKLGTASNGTTFWIVTVGNQSVRLVSWDFTHGWSWVGTAFDTLNTIGMSLPFGGDWFTYNEPSSSPSLRVRNVLTGEVRGITYPSNVDHCEDRLWFDATTLGLMCWDSSELTTTYAVSSPDFDTLVPRDFPIDPSGAVSVAERYQVPGTPLVLTGDPVRYQGGLTAVGVMTTEGYREIASYGPREDGTGSGPQLGSLRQIAPGLFVSVSSGGPREEQYLVIDVVTGQVVDYTFVSPNWDLWRTTLLYEPVVDSS